MDGTPPHDQSSQNFFQDKSSDPSEVPSSDHPKSDTQPVEVGNAQGLFGALSPEEAKQFGLEEGGNVVSSKTSSPAKTDQTASSCITQIGRQLNFLRPLSRRLLTAAAKKALILDSANRKNTPDFSDASKLTKAQAVWESGNSTRNVQNRQVPSAGKRNLDTLHFHCSDPNLVLLKSSQKVIIHCNSKSDLMANEVANLERDPPVGMAKFAQDTGNVDIVFFDYGGTGRSSGTPSGGGCVKDCLAIAKDLVEQGYDPNNIIFSGRSMGGGVAAEAALKFCDPKFQQSLGHEKPVQPTLLLPATFKSFSCATRHCKAVKDTVNFPGVNRAAAQLTKIFGWNLKTEENSQKLIKNHSAKVIVMSHKQDQVIPEPAQLKLAHDTAQTIDISALKSDLDNQKNAEVRKKTSFEGPKHTFHDKDDEVFKAQLSHALSNNTEIWVDASPDNDDESACFRIDIKVEGDQVVLLKHGSNEPCDIDKIRQLPFYQVLSNAVPQGQLANLHEAAQQDDQQLHVDIDGTWKLVTGFDEEGRALDKDGERLNFQNTEAIDYKLVDIDAHNAPLQMDTATYNQSVETFRNTIFRDQSKPS